MKKVEVGERTIEVRVRREGEERFRGVLGGRDEGLEARRTPAGSWLLVNGGRVVEAFVDGDREEVRVYLAGVEVPVRIQDPVRDAVRKVAAGTAGGPATVSSPMPGKVVVVLVGEGDPVEEGDGLVVVEAMKMENELRSPKAGKVVRVAVKAGQAVEAGAPLVVVE